MLLLVTILLVLVAAVTLLIGIFSDNLALIFVSIGASALAAIVLAVLSQVSKRKGRDAVPATGPEPLPAREPATVGGGRQAAQAEQAVADIATIGEPVGVAAEAPTTTMTSVGSGALPISGYDTMRVNEILPALEDLDLDQLETVAQHEEGNKNRTTILNRIDDLMDELEAQEAGGGAAAAPAAADVSEIEAVAVDSIEDIGEPVVAVSGGASGFPIADYDDLDEDELIARLEELDADQLEAVADREEAGQNRDAVLDAIDDRLDILEGIVPAPAAAAVTTATKAPAKKAATKAPAKAAVATKTASKAPAKAAAASKTASKAPAKSAAATKTAAKTTAKKSGVTSPTATRKAAAPAPAKRSAPATAKKAATPAKKTTAAPAKRTAASKAPAKKAATATKKAGTSAKKAAPVKKAAAAKKSSKR